MENKKIRLGILFGGRSAEHEISLISAKNIIEGLDYEKYEVVLIGIDKSGAWKVRDEQQYLLHANDPKLIALEETGESIALIPKDQRKELVCYSGDQLQKVLHLDVVFPVLHGTYGEDGTVQGLLKLANIPFVGASVLGSAVGMDKDVMKRLLRDAQIPVARFMTIHQCDRANYSFEYLVDELNLPFFVKPANLGSSVGINKVSDLESFVHAMDQAFLYDRKVLVEENITGREIECSVLGNDFPIASLPGEVIPQHEYYSYDAKYLDECGALFQIPVELPAALTQHVQELAVKAFKVLCCEGMARVDFFLRGDGQLFVNEINTIPGFTSISMYPKLWEVSGMKYSQLLDRLIELSLERHAQERVLKTTF